MLVAFVANAAFAQKDNLKKNTQASEDEKKRYEKDLEENPDSAGPHWRHANNVAAIKESEDAWKFYEKALEIDSMNASIWNDYGDYLVNIDEPDDALYMYEKAVALEPGNTTLAQKASDLSAKLELKRTTMKMRSIGLTDKRKVDHGLSYAVITNFDSLTTLARDEHGRYNYEKQLARFMMDEPLNEWETYILCLGYAASKDYTPFGYNPARDLYELNAAGKFDEVIAQKDEVLKRNPVNASVYRELMYAFRRKGDKVNASRFERRAQRLYEAMIFTGDGTCEKPYVTLSTMEEYGLIGFMGLYFTGPQTLISCAGLHADKMTIEGETEKDEALYFNVELLFARMTELMKK